jgi:hypothetical protein
VNPGVSTPWSRRRRPTRQDGVILVIALLMLMVLTVLGTTGLVTSVLELRMAANTQYKARAFEAAEFAIEQAIRSPGLATSISYSSPLMVPASGAAPEVPGSAPDAYSYRVYYDTSTDAPPGAGADAGLRAYHFVIEATGTSSRGAAASHVQGFYVLGPQAATSALTPPACAPACANPALYEPVRTFWLQRNAE